jgi:hypothetical protein
VSEKHFQLIRRKYQQRNAEDLFETILSVAGEIGLDAALAYLEQCVTEKRLAWLDANLETFDRTGDPVADGYRLFYEVYLGISAPDDGEIVEQTRSRMVTRWWNHCSTLDVCNKLGLDTREICSKAYHGPVQVFLSRIDPRLVFERNYDALRPHAPYCEEIISLKD